MAEHTEMAFESRRQARARNRRQIIGLGLMGFGLLALGLVALLLLAKGSGTAPVGSDASGNAPAKVNYAAPDLDLTDLSGNAVSLEDYRGQVVLVNNWATWCPPCKEEMPTLQAYHNVHAGEGFSVVAIDSGDPAEEVAAFVQEAGLTFPVWLDVEQKAIIAFNNYSLPSSYVVDRQGKVRLAWTGIATMPMLEKYVTPLIAE